MPHNPIRLTRELVDIPSTTGHEGEASAREEQILQGFGFDCGRCQGEGKVGRRLPVPVHVPPGLRDGAVFQVRTDDPAVPSILLTVHLRRA